MSAPASEFDVAVVTGMSGAGRSTAARALEDIGWFVIDNLPPSLLRPAIDIAQARTDVRRLAVVVDARGRALFADLSRALDELMADATLSVRVMFLEASDESLVRRFESSRRPHPLQGAERIVDGLRVERTVLGDLRARADVVIDTTNLNVHDLRRKVEAAFAATEGLHATVLSFGFKYGIPVDADMVADVRFLANPHWDDALRPMSGLDAPVRDAVLSEPACLPFVDAYEAVLDLMTDGYLREGKRYLTLAVGCTGGRHRSVAVAEEIARRMRASGIPTLVVHRDLGRE